jgi:hypothetical protein
LYSFIEVATRRLPSGDKNESDASSSSAGFHVSSLFKVGHDTIVRLPTKKLSLFSNGVLHDFATVCDASTQNLKAIIGAVILHGYLLAPQHFSSCA